MSQTLRQRRKTFKKWTVKDFPKKRRKSKKAAEFQIPERPQVEELGNPRVREIHRIIGGQFKEAEQVATLEQNNPSSTLPELVTMNWLNGQGVIYVPQAYVLGGRSSRGGMVPDFLVRFKANWSAWLIQGSWYHSSEFQQRYMQEGRDITARLTLKGAAYAGYLIEEVVTLDEEAIYEDRPLIFELAMSGQSLSV